VFAARYGLNAYYNRHVSSSKVKTSSEYSVICKTGATSRVLVSQSLTLGRPARCQQSAHSNPNVTVRSGTL